MELNPKRIVLLSRVFLSIAARMLLISIILFDSRFSVFQFGFKSNSLIQAYVSSIRGSCVYKRRECFRVNVSSFYLAIRAYFFSYYLIDFENGFFFSEFAGL